MPLVPVVDKEHADYVIGPSKYLLDWLRDRGVRLPGNMMVQQYVLRLAQTAIEYPPMQAPASFNLDAIKTEIQEKIKAHEGQ